MASVCASKGEQEAIITKILPGTKHPGKGEIFKSPI